MNHKEIWQKLSAIDVSAHVEKKNGLSYLSWAWAWGVLMEHFPEAEYSFDPPQTFDNGTMMVFCTVTIGDRSRRMWLPVMNHKNQAIPNPDAFAVNTAMMRCLVKCLALWGLGHYIYAGEDLPQAELERLYSPISEHQHQELVGMIASLDGDIDMPAFLKFFGISFLSNMKQSDYPKAKAALEAKILKSKGVANASN
jgi:hypothetical protein